jgi:hypothetical protein
VKSDSSFALKFVVLIIGLLGVLGADAQAKPAGVGPGLYTTVGIAGSAFQTDYGKTIMYAPTIYVDAHIHRYFGIEAEARFLRYGGKNGVQMDEYMVGPRYVFKPEGWVPYVKMPVGLAKMKFPYGLATGNYFVMAPGAGLEKWIANDNIHIRLIDVEYQLWPQFTYGTLHPYGVSAGISFRVW